MVDQGLTPQKPRDPIEFKGEKVFADSSSFVLQSGSSLALGKRSMLVIDNGSTLTLLKGSVIEIAARASIIIESSAKIKVMDGATIRGRGKIILKEASAADFSNGASIDVRLKR